MKHVVVDARHIFIGFIVSMSALVSKTWIEVSGFGPLDVAKQLKDQQMIMAGHRKGSMYKELRPIILIAGEAL